MRFAISGPIIVNESMARTYWPGERAVGKCVVIFLPGNPCHAVVGVVSDAHAIRIIEKPVMQYYVPARASAQYLGLRRCTSYNYSSVLVNRFVLHICTSRCVRRARACPGVYKLVYPSRTREALPLRKTDNGALAACRARL